ncbi:hypothetical protein BP1258A_2653 [Burkholderia pseudomallei 1258a]|uniref:Uncharacterized protein n=1 Tax=Burkholderia pseudomallei (strain 1026b) TaxID=884204 RepID=A0A0H3HP80_BURP2|nr:hypothetical protein BP1026B_I3550 [Burkholderia pseudomallei 1026b]EIF62114.1 hypothetical protein BP1258A_2653 [Burkholderia pseudomallei 1258a]EIF62903.1 hypothetical protein BP1258B_3119 [Burkholderia pseudomallei 1258b]EIF64798.1 hypothetical protein BP1026A_1625 [Burkholderia pseudomallei 1026a]EIF75208.1 hypothetical protein BP354E_2576 [Burkholderia pseudomallei 354e]EIF79647.1 hypothetical protein BP354A_3157 [Burkholderia pseudomallei 354a]
MKIENGWRRKKQGRIHACRLDYRKSYGFRRVNDCQIEIDRSAFLLE